MKMSRPNRIFPAWKKGKKGERPPGSHPRRHRPILAKPAQSEQKEAS